MNIGCAYLTYTGTPPYMPDQPVDYRYFGEFVSPERAPKQCPMIFFELPIAGPVTAVLWHTVLENGNYLTKHMPFLWAGFSEPKYSSPTGDPPLEMVLLLEYATEYWKPFTSLEAAAMLMPALIEMTQPELDDFLGRLGNRENLKKREVLRKKMFIASCWANWAKAGLSYEERVADMEKNGVPITLHYFKKLVTRDMSLNRHPIE